MSTLTKPITIGVTLLCAAMAPVAEAQWAPDSISSARQTIASATVGQKAIFAGGRVGNVISGVVDIYDDATGVWSTDTLPVPRTAAAGAAIGKYALFAGGAISASTPSAVVDILDTETMTWSSVNLSQARSGAAATTVGDIVLIAGGNAGSLFVPIASDVVDIYDAAIGTPDNPAAWSTATLSVARGGVAAASAGGRAIFVGGINSNAVAQSVVDIYDGATRLWSVGPPLSQARSAPASASNGTRAYFAGGVLSQTAISDVVDIYDAVSSTWSTEKLSEPRSFLSAAAVGDRVLFAGGFNIAQASARVDVFDVATSMWLPNDELPLGRGDMGSTSVSGKAIFAGGVANSGLSTQADLYDATWMNLASGKDGVSGVPVLNGTGSLAAGAPLTLSLSNAAASTQAHLVIGFTPLNVPFYGGFLVPNPDVLVTPLPTNASGELVLMGALPPGLPSGFSFYFQYLVSDGAATLNLSMSNAIQGTTP